jgi:hypothetical protein
MRDIIFGADDCARKFKKRHRGYRAALRRHLGDVVGKILTGGN